jgi:hypothetical protein
MKKVMLSLNRRRSSHSFCRVTPIVVLAFVLMAASSTFGQVIAPTVANLYPVGGYDNEDVRYPSYPLNPSLYPNDIDLVYYGCGLSTNDFRIVGSWDTSNPDDGLANLNWGLPTSITHSIGTDPTNPGYGLDCVTVRYSGPPRPNIAGQVAHVGPWVKYGANIVHKEIWWTLNGQRTLQLSNPQTTWQWCNGRWIACVMNPCPVNIYVYGPQCFQVPRAPATGIRLPLLTELALSIQPTNFGATAWTPLLLPTPTNTVVTRLFCIPPWCRLYFSCPAAAVYRPSVLQIAVRNVSEDVLPLPPTFQGPVVTDYVPDTSGTNPAGFGTQVILTSRPLEQVPESLTLSGAVGIPDFNMFRSWYGFMSEDALH